MASQYSDLLVQTLGQAHCDGLMASIGHLQDSNYFYTNGVFVIEKTNHARQACKLFRLGVLRLIGCACAFPVLEQFVHPLEKLMLISSEQNWFPEVYYTVESLALILNRGLNRDYLASPADFDRLKSMVSECHSYVEYVIQKFPVEADAATVDHTADFLFLASIPRSVARSLNGKQKFTASIIFLKSLDENFDALGKPLQELNETVTKGNSNEVYGPSLKILEILLSCLESYGKRQLCSMLILGNIDVLNAILKNSAIGVDDRVIVNKIIKMILISLLLRYPNLSEELSKNKQDALFRCPPWYGKEGNTREAFKFLLSALDNGFSLAYLDSLQALSTIQLSIKQINICCHSKRELYSQFNPLRSKISLTTVCLLTNYILAANLLGGISRGSIPAAISKRMQLLENPPLSEPDGLSLSSLTASDPELRMYLNQGNYDLILEALTFNLYVASDFLADEMSALCFINKASSELLRKKLVFKFSELILSSLVTSLMLSSVCKRRVLALQAIQELAYTIIDSLLRHKLTQSTEPFELWVCLLNFANDVCYSDLKYVSVMANLFESLTRKNPTCLESPLVRSGLLLFEMTFQNSEKETPTELSLADYRFLYESSPITGLNARSASTPASAWGSTTTAGDSSEYDLTKLYTSQGRPAQVSRAGYSTSAGRQQSVHVDQYGKT